MVNEYDCYHLSVVITITASRLYGYTNYKTTHNLGITTYYQIMCVYTKVIHVFLVCITIVCLQCNNTSVLLQVYNTPRDRLG